MLLVLALAAAAVRSDEVQAQVPVDPILSDTIIFNVRAPRWAEHVSIAASNIVIGGLTAGIFQELRGGSFKDGFARGALGGVFTYTGKRITAQRFAGAGFLGREVAAVGSSIIRNAGAAQPMFSLLDLPVGFIRVQYRPATRRITASLDLNTAYWTAYGIAEPELHLDVDETLSAGAFVFRTKNKIIASNEFTPHAGGTFAGMVMQSNVPAFGQPLLSRVLGHERVHVSQHDQIYTTLLAPGERWLFSKTPAGARIDRVVDLNFSTELLVFLNRLFPDHWNRPWEAEANYLSR
jgi:hypothetical protein